MRVEPVTEDALRGRLVERILVHPAPAALRVLIDGHPSTDTGQLADSLVEPLRAAGRPVARIRVDDFLRPASLRLEMGRRDPDSLLDAWIDVAGLNREVLTAVGPEGQGRYLPTLRDPVTDRATRAPYVDAPPGLVVLLDGSLAMGRWLDLDLVVHLSLRSSTITRRTSDQDRWTLEAYERYREEVEPEVMADVVVRVDDARRPAVVTR
ncbi:hypothetical protein Sked_16890 [Sanguibacter keddieii DSM 10542]|uniref:Uridine kinase n=1 Tax=Sanguibacter keddieii (strain ATCC 51767 / DSM 10542 / NCFB 3025 / ST-74) TaxID=446469 RepID=D1BGP0_SANKS|nr:uridine kinase [Sanguibacter keddieii]ACZ21617.1 hypothetical protein Sked_16890 [Sanguibacter keddieii DSM 10542]